MMPLRLLLHYFFLLLFPALACGQHWQVGFNIEAGANNRHQYPYLAPVAEVGGGFGIGLEVDYRLSDHFNVGFHPVFLRQQIHLRYPPTDQQIFGRQEKVYPATLLFPIRASYYFGEQRFRPGFSVAAGFLVESGQRNYESGLVTEPFLPYLEVSIGVDRTLGRFGLRPEIRFRESLGPFVRRTPPGPFPYVRYRWQHISLGISLYL